MAIKFQYNKTSLQQQQKALKMRVRALPTIKSKESALRVEVKRVKQEVEALEEELRKSMAGYDSLVALWSEFDPTLVKVTDIKMQVRKVAGTPVPELDSVEFQVKPFSLMNSPAWYMDGTRLIQDMATIGIKAEVGRMELGILEYNRRKTTQKVNLFEKVQIPGYQDAIRKIKRFLEDEESLSKASQKIMRENLERKAREEEQATL